MSHETEFRLHDVLYTAMEPGDTATMLCATCGWRTPVSELTTLFGLEPECGKCGKVMPLELAQVIVTCSTPERQRALEGKVLAWANEHGQKAVA